MHFDTLKEQSTIAMARNVLPILLILVASTRGNEKLKGSISQKSAKRGLKEAWDDDNSGVTNTWSEAAPSSNRTSFSEIPSKIVNQVQQYKEAAETKAWEFYQSSPSEWTENQWDFLLGLFGGLLLLSCSFVSMCCAYFCIHRDQDDSFATKDRYKNLILQHWRTSKGYRRHEKKSTEQDESRSTFDSRAPIYSASSCEHTTDDKRECLLKERNSFKMNEQSRSVNKNQGTHEVSNHYVVTNESQSVFDPLSNTSELSYFEIESINMEAPRRTAG